MRDTYQKMWGQMDQTKLLSIIEYKEKMLNLALLEPKVLKGQPFVDYKATQIRVKFDEINLAGIVEFHM